MNCRVPVLEVRFPDGHLLRCTSRCALQRADVLSLPALRALGDVEFDALALLEALETASLDCREVHENVFASLPADEGVALSVIEPLYCSLFCHLNQVSFSIDFTLEGIRKYVGQALAGWLEAVLQPTLIRRLYTVSEKRLQRECLCGAELAGASMTSVPLRAMVKREAPSQWTTAVGANPAPFTVSVSVALPGLVLAGANA